MQGSFATLVPIQYPVWEQHAAVICW